VSTSNGHVVVAPPSQYFSLYSRLTATENKLQHKREKLHKNDCHMSTEYRIPSAKAKRRYVTYTQR